MRHLASFLMAGVALSLVGCAGPEQKLGRGLNNTFEFVRMGEIRRSVEQTALWENPSRARTTGFIRGFNRSVARTAVGLYEVVTFPIPPFDPVLTPKAPLYPDLSVATTKYPYGGFKLSEEPVHPDSYKPGRSSGPLFDTDTSLGFSAGDAFPLFPGSRFRVFDE